MQNKALFLDRDGVINIDHGYVYLSTEFEFQAGIFELCQQAQQAGYLLVIVTNQSGIGRGYYSEDDFAQLTKWMTEQFAEHGVKVAGTYFCPHHPSKALGEYKQDCDCRKPKPGMLLQAAKEHNIDVTKSIMLGDKESDMQAADAANIAIKVLLQSHYSDGENSVADKKIKQLADFTQLAILN